MEAKRLVILAESVVAAAALSKPSINDLCELVGSYRSKVLPLQDLYENLGDLEKIRRILYMNHDGFLSRNTEVPQQLLEECRRLLEASKSACIILNVALSDVLQPSALWGPVRDAEIRRMASVTPSAAAELRIWAMTLELLDQIMQL
jgi:hypothetical protein